MAPAHRGEGGVRGRNSDARAQATRTLLVALEHLRLNVEKHLHLLLLEERDLLVVDVELLLQLRRRVLDEALGHRRRGLGRGVGRPAPTRLGLPEDLAEHSAQPKASVLAVTEPGTA